MKRADALHLLGLAALGGGAVAAMASKVAGWPFTATLALFAVGAALWGLALAAWLVDGGWRIIALCLKRPEAWWWTMDRIRAALAEEAMEP